MIYEYRIYEVRPEKIEALHQRFEQVTLALFKKHDVRVVGFWMPMIGASNELHYLVEWDDMDHYFRSWDAFEADPEWIAALAESERDGPLELQVRNQLWRPTRYSPRPSTGP